MVYNVIHECSTTILPPVKVLCKIFWPADMNSACVDVAGTGGAVK